MSYEIIIAAAVLVGSLSLGCFFLGMWAGWRLSDDRQSKERLRALLEHDN